MRAFIQRDWHPKHPPLSCALLSCALFVLGCQNDTKAQAPAPEAAKAAPPAPAAPPVPTTPPAQAVPPAPVAVAAPPAAPESEDPVKGKFTLDDATAGLKGKGALTATIEVTHGGKALGTFHCELFADKSPNTVANFVGLARGLRPFKDPKTGKWVKRPLYNNLSFHRVIPDFMIQGGDPQCQNDGTCGGRGGTGDPGYMFGDEVDNGLRLDKGGLLAMANRGQGTNGSQFFITEKETPWLTGHHTIFGACGEVDLVKKITGVERGPRDVPKDPVTITKVTIARKAK